MSDKPAVRPDLTLTLDCDGVIELAVPAEIVGAGAA